MAPTQLEPCNSPSSAPGLAEDVLRLCVTDNSVMLQAPGSAPLPVLSRLHCTVTAPADAPHDGNGSAPPVSRPADGTGGVVLGLSTPGSGSSSLLDCAIGQLAPGRMLVCARCKLWWMTPEWRSRTADLPPEIQFLLLELQPGGHGPYALLLPLIDGDFRATLRPPSSPSGAPSENGIVLRVESGDARVAASSWQSLLHISAGTNPFTLVERGVAAAAALSGGAQPLAAKQLPPSLDVFGWCTWDAFYSTVSAKGIQEGLASLVAGGITPRTLIIDDGWQMTDTDPPSDAMPPVTPSEVAQRLDWLPVEERQLLASTQDEFYRESREVLADTAAKLPQSSSVSTSMPALSNLSASQVPNPQHPTAAVQPAQGTTGSIASGTSLSSMDPSQAPHSGAEKAATKADGEASTAVSTQPQAVGSAAAAGITAGGGSGVTAADGGNADALLVARLGQKLAGWVVGLGTAAFLIAYQWVVEPAAPGSLPVRTFAALAQGLLRPAMLGFYAGASDFTRRLTSVRANSKFSSPTAGPEEPWGARPARLDEVVASLKAQWGVHYVYCWHGLPAYWAGVMPGAPEVAKFGANIMYAKPTPGVLEVEPSMAWNPAVLAGVGVLADPAAVYQDMHAYLRESGVDGVKVDCQAGVGLVGSALGGGPALSRTFQAALERSIAHHFPANHAINCMCHSTENLYRMTSTAVARASDDFYPRDPASSHPHIAACAFNSLFLSALLQPDWDMFHSKHPAARLHGMARAVSGAAVYVSDRPGEHDFELLRTLVLPDGSTLRAARPGRPTRDCLFSDVLRDGKTVLKVWNVNAPLPNAAHVAPVNGIVGAFNVQGSSWDRTRRKFWVHSAQPPTLKVQVHPHDVEGLAEQTGAQRFAVLAYTSGHLSVMSTHDAPLTASVAAASGEVFTLAPIHQARDVSLAVLGLHKMMNGGGAVKAVRLHDTASSSSNGNGLLAAAHSHGPPAAPSPHHAPEARNSASSRAHAGRDRGVTAHVSVRGCGPLLVWASHKPHSVTVSGLAILPSSWDATSGRLVLDVPPCAGSPAAGGNGTADSQTLGSESLLSSQALRAELVLQWQGPLARLHPARDGARCAAPRIQDAVGCPMQHKAVMMKLAQTMSAAACSAAV